MLLSVIMPVFGFLYSYGGLYFDTDVEVISPMDDILAKGGFMGVQHDYFFKSRFRNGVSGLSPNL